MKGRGHSFSAYPVDVVNYDDCARKCAQIQAECGPDRLAGHNAASIGPHSADLGALARQSLLTTSTGYAEKLWPRPSSLEPGPVLGVQGE